MFMENPDEVTTVRGATRNGKIARLPHEIRERLNRALRDGQEQRQLIDWLNSLAEVQAVLAQHFDGAPIKENNLSHWNARGYREWLEKAEAMKAVRLLAANSADFQRAAGGSMAN